MSGKIKLRGATQASRPPSGVYGAQQPKRSTATLVVGILGWCGTLMMALVLVGVIFMLSTKKKAQEEEFQAELTALMAKDKEHVAELEDREAVARQVFKEAIDEQNHITREVNRLNAQNRRAQLILDRKKSQWEQYAKNLEAHAKATGIQETDPELLRRQKIQLGHMVRSKQQTLQQARDLVQQQQASAEEDRRAALEKLQRQRELEMQREMEEQRKAEEKKAVAVEIRKWDFEFNAFPRKGDAGRYGGDNQIQTISVGWSLRNRHHKRASFEGLKLKLMVYGKLTYAKAYQVIIKDEFTFDVDFLETHEDRTREVKLHFDNSGYKWGAKYKGYVGVIEDANGKTLLTFSTSSRLESNIEQVMNYDVNEVFDQNGEESNVAVYSYWYY